MKDSQKSTKSKQFFRETNFDDYWTKKIRGNKFEQGYSNHFIDLVEVEKNDAVLEVGTGEGRFIPSLVDKGVSYIGIDISDRILKRAKERVQTCNKSDAVLVTADAEHLPFRNNIFDFALSFSTIFVVPNMEKALIEMSRVSKRKVLIEFRSLFNLGVFWDYFLCSILSYTRTQVLYISILKIKVIKKVLEKLFGQERVDRIVKNIYRGWIQPYYPITPFGLRKMFQKADLKISFIEGCNPTNPGGLNFTSKMKWTKPAIIVCAQVEH